MAVVNCNEQFFLASVVSHTLRSKNKWDKILSLVMVQIVFDECHKAKNLCPVGSSKPTKTGLAVLELQNKLPKARVVYASATGTYNLLCVQRLSVFLLALVLSVFLS